MEDSETTSAAQFFHKKLITDYGHIARLQPIRIIADFKNILWLCQELLIMILSFRLSLRQVTDRCFVTQIMQNLVLQICILEGRRLQSA